jgi:hypothetical protein
MYNMPYSGIMLNYILPQLPSSSSVGYVKIPYEPVEEITESSSSKYIIDKR